MADPSICAHSLRVWGFPCGAGFPLVVLGPKAPCGLPAAIPKPPPHRPPRTGGCDYTSALSSLTSLACGWPVIHRAFGGRAFCPAIRAPPSHR